MHARFTIATGWNIVEISGPQCPADLPVWSDQVCMLLSHCGVVVCDMRGLREANLGVIDVLARLQLTARRAHARLLLRGLNGRLRDLWEWIGLDDLEAGQSR